MRFSATFPGGVFWLDLEYDPDPLPGYVRQVRTICVALGLPAVGALDDMLSVLAIDLHRRGEPCLWVIDGVPAGLPPAQVKMFFAPHPLAATLLITRGGYHDLATELDLDDAPREPHGSGRRSEAERAAAFALQTELATRVGVQPLAEGAGRLREALDSLYALFTAARQIQRRYGTGAGPMLPVVDELLNDVLRPFLTRWHTALAVHEERREPRVGAWAHERAWDAGPVFRAELAELRGPLRAALGRLSQISGVTPRH